MSQSTWIVKVNKKGSLLTGHNINEQAEFLREALELSEFQVTEISLKRPKPKRAIVHASHATR